jgi:hypothetical protein
MKARSILLAAIVLVPLLALGRIIQIIDPKKLIADSKLVFVGRVKSVKPSDIRTGLSYPTWDRVAFRWLIADVEVLEPVKAVRKGDIVHTAMLSIDEHSPSQSMVNPPGMLGPDIGDVFFLCLAPTPQTNLYAALSGPWDENLSVIALHRDRSTQDDYRDFTDKTVFSRDDRYAPIRSLVNTNGEILSTNVDKLRKIYAKEIRTSPSKALSYLEWVSYTNKSGWWSDVPKGFVPPTNAKAK